MFQIFFLLGKQKSENHTVCGNVYAKVQNHYFVVYFISLFFFFLFLLTNYIGILLKSKLCKLFKEHFVWYLIKKTTFAYGNVF